MMKHINKTMLITLIITLLTGCCWTDYSETIKEIAEPMLKTLDAFYKKNKRFPSIEERNKMLMESGCRKVEKDKCSYKWKNLKVNLDVEKYEYSLTLVYDHSYCNFGIFDDGKLMPYSCDKVSCIYAHQ